MDSGLSQSVLKRLTNVFDKFSPLEKAILFGSRAKGVQERGSDIDIAVKGLNDRDVIRLSMCLNEETELPYFFDVVDLDSVVSPDLISHIQRVGRVIYEGG
jgi:uncharacterized protein